MSTLPGMWDVLDLPSLDVDLFEFVRLRGAEFDDMIGARGVLVDFWSAQACPCARQESQAPRADCLACYGMGWLYPKRLRKEQIRILLAGLGDQRRSDGAGNQISGTASICTFPTEVYPKPGSLILRKDQEHLVEELVTRRNPLVSASMVATMRYSELETGTYIREGEDRLRYPYVERIEGIWRWSSETKKEALRMFGKPFEGLTNNQKGVVRETTCPEVPMGAYELHGNVIRWKDGFTPKPGDVYSVRYRARATYMIIDEPSFRSDEDEHLPYKCRAVRYDSWSPDDRGAP